jgi:hypothetical protein
MDSLSSAPKVWSSDSAVEGLAEAGPGDMQDAAQFRQWLQPAAADPSADAPMSPLGGVLQAAGQSLHERENSFNKALERAARTGDPVEGLAVQQRLSDLYLEHGLAVKVIAQATTAIVKITTLS